MILGYSSNAFTKFSIFQTVEMIAQLGFSGIEIMCDRPHLYPLDFSEVELNSLKKTIESNKLIITNLNSFTLFALGDAYLPSWIDPSQERRQLRIDHTLRCLELSHCLGCKNISVPPGGPLNGMPWRKAINLFVEGLEQVASLAEKLDVRILVEPEPDLLIENSRQFKNFINEVKSPAVGLNFDIGHFFCAGEDPGIVFDELYQWIGHIHLEDIHANRAHRHLIPGHGSINFFKFFEVMRSKNYTGDITMELYPYADAPVEAGMEGLRYILPLFEKAGLKVMPTRSSDQKHP
jgi:sugar phosphate isomerase/epimerase